jgi:hypothetical protein
MRLELHHQVQLGLGQLVAAARALLVLLLALLHRAEIGQHQFRRDHLNVAHRINRPGNVMDVVVLETAHDLDDRVHLADMGQELVAQPLALARALDQPGDIHELEHRRHELLRFREIGELLQPLVRHGDNTGVRIDRAERIIGRLRLAGLRDCIEKRALPDVRQPDNSRAQHKRSSLTAAKVHGKEGRYPYAPWIFLW